MRVRALVREEKREESDTHWRWSDLQPRFAPIFVRTRPIRAGWQWRSARVRSASRSYVLLSQCNPKRGNWLSMLILECPEGSSVVARLEDHSSHPGVHVHTHCGRSGIETGAQALDDLARWPAANAFHRRRHAWTPDEFWQVSRRFFRVETPAGGSPAQGALPI